MRVAVAVSLHRVPGLSRLDPRTLRLVAVGAASYLGRLGGALALLVNVPLARQMLDAERFGVWMMLSALLGFFAFADLGIGNAVLNRVTAAAVGDGRRRQHDLAREIVAGYVCTGAVGLGLLLAGLAWWGLAGDPVALVGRVSDLHRADVLAGLSTFAVLLALNVPASLIQKIQLGAQDGQWVGVAQFVASMATLAALPAVLLLGGGLAALVLASLGVQVLVNLGATAWWLRRQGGLRWLRGAGVERPVVLAVLRGGGLFFALQLAAAFAFQSDAIVITQTLGPAAYGDFSVVQRLFLLVTAGLSAGLTGLWPAFGDAVARGDLRWVRKVLLRALLLTGIVAVAATLVLVLAIETISVRWLQAAAPPALALTLALAAWTVVEALGAVAGACMNGANLLRAQLLIALAMATLAFAGKWWAVGMFGLPGAVLATLVAYLLVSVPGQIFIFRRMFSMDTTHR